MNYYQIRDKRLLKAYAYDKKKKELKDGRQNEDNTKERCEEEKTTT